MSDSDAESDTEREIFELQSALVPSNQTNINVTYYDSLKQTESIESCKRAIVLNEKCGEILKLLQYRLGLCLSRCTRNLDKLRDAMGNPKSDWKLAKNDGSYYKLGCPYFKDCNEFPSPPNSDVEKVKMLGIETYPGRRAVKWSNPQKNYLLQEIHSEAKRKRRYELQCKMRKVEREIKSLEHSVATDIRQKIIELQNQLESLSCEMKDVENAPIEALVLPLKDKEDFDWDKISFGGGKRLLHSPRECEAMWRLFQHPEINKSGWTNQEQSLLKYAAQKHHLQNWDSIARVLNTQRSCYQCFLFYRLRLTTEGPWEWTPEEDKYLQSLVQDCRIGTFIPWSKVAYYMENRSKAQCYNRWMNAVANNVSGRFLPEEDTFILAAVKKFGTNFVALSKYMPHRKPALLKKRFQILNSSRTKGYRHLWTPKNDKKLWALASQCELTKDNDVDFSKIMQYFPGKSQSVLRSRYRVLKKWLKKSKTNTILNAPRRSTRFRLGAKCIDFEKALKSLQERLSHGMVRKRRKVAKSPDGTLTNKILQYFQQNDGYLVNSSPSKYPTAQADFVNLRNILLLLGAQLDKDLLDSIHFNSENVFLKIIALELMKVEENSPAMESQIKVIRTYSRKNKQIPNSLNSSPSGNKKQLSVWVKGTENVDMDTEDNNYILPPNLSSLLAFKNMLMQDFARTDYYQNFNPELMPHIGRWNQRFNTLFTWPANLSNIPCRINNSIFEENCEQSLQMEPQLNGVHTRQLRSGPSTSQLAGRPRNVDALNKNKKPVIKVKSLKSLTN